jgi:riboflavin kinase / FMN adenylyltransferase
LSSLRSGAPPRKPTLCAIGNFDGVHRGHVEVLARAAREAKEAGIEPIAVTFDPPPAVVLGRSPPAALTPLQRKIELIGAFVPSIRVVVKTFDRALSEYAPERFAREVLVGELGAVRALVGQNFRFGKGRVGDLATLVELGEGLGFAARAMELVGDDRGPWSSTRVRRSLESGDWADVERVLGRPHALSGVVVRGDQRGRTIGFPTANLGGVEEVFPPFGVYAVLVDRLDRPDQPRALARGVANVGVRPTVSKSGEPPAAHRPVSKSGDAGPSTEVHLLDFHPEKEEDLDLYGARLRLHLVSFLRAERKFDGLDALKTQIVADAERARTVLEAKKPTPGPLLGWY